MKHLLSMLWVLSGTLGFAAEPAEPAIADEPSIPAATPAAPAPSDPQVVPRTNAGPERDATLPAEGKVLIYVIPVREAIDEPVLYIVRRGVKDAMEAGAQFVVLDMDTPGGRLDVTLEIIEILQEKYQGRSVTFVNREAISAGAFISAGTNDIYFSPRGVIGAAAPVSAEGKDIDKTMEQKILSYLRARVETITEGHKFRAEVLFAMMDDDYELKIGDTVIKPKGELLSLTAAKAMQEYGDPPVPLLGAGIVEDLPALYEVLAAGAPYELRQFEVTWSIKVFRWFNAVGPVLIGLGMIGIYLEFQTGGHGMFAGAGVALLLIVFLGYNTAGLSGHEPMIVFVAGLVFIVADVFLFPGTFILGTVGALMVLGSLLWAMADIWPNEPVSFSGDLFVGPLTNLALGMAIAGGGVLILMRVLPRSRIFNRLAISQAIAGAAQTSGGAPETGHAVDELVGQTGIAVTGLFPSGQIEIAGRRYEARVAYGTVARGDAVVVKSRSDFGIIVEAVKS